MLTRAARILLASNFYLLTSVFFLLTCHPSLVPVLHAQGGGPPGATVRTLAIDPANPATLYAGTNGGGVFKSTNGGTSWTAVLPSLSIQSLAIDPVTRTTLYAGTETGGVLKSTNGGGSWTYVGNSGTGLTATGVQALAIDPSAPATLYAATNGGGVFKSTNGGTSWIAVNSGLTATGVRALAIDPSTPATLYAGTATNSGGGGVFKSTNGGASWTAVNSDLTNPQVFALAIDPSTPATLYAGGGNFFIVGVSKSTNGGTSWTAANSGLPTFTSVFDLAIDPSAPATLYAGTSSGVFKSINGGTSWAAINSGIPVFTTVRALAIDPSTPATLYAGTAGSGVFKSANGGTTWQPTGANEGNGAPPAATISKVSGDNQTGNAAQPLRYPLVAVVTNAEGIPVAGVTVNFAVTAGGGIVSTTSIVTEEHGVALTTLTLGPNLEINTVEARATGLSGSPARFNAGPPGISLCTNLVGDVAPLLADSNGDGDSDDCGEFGSESLTTVDLILALRAATNLPGWLPPSCSDRYDTMDSSPADTDTTRGGNALLSTTDLIITLRRVTGIDSSRRRRSPRGLPCP